MEKKQITDCTGEELAEALANAYNAQAQATAQINGIISELARRKKDDDGE